MTANSAPPHTPEIYCDRLRPAVVVRLLADRMGGRRRRGDTVRILDGPAVGFAQRMGGALLAASGLRAAEVPFFAGDLRTPSGESVPVSAQKIAFTMADAAARLLIARSPRLSAVAARWHADTLRLFLARQRWVAAERFARRVLTAEALRRDDASPAELLIAWPGVLPVDVAASCPTRLTIRLVGREKPHWKFGRWSALVWSLRQALRRLRRPPLPPVAPDAPPALLVPQEDHVSPDRSFRVQPHWLDGTPPFRTIILRLAGTFDVEYPAEARRHARIEVVDVGDVAAEPRRTAEGAACRREFRRLCAGGLLATDVAGSTAMADAARLLLTAAELADFCAGRRVRAFLTCENYLLHADAMNIVARVTGIRTLAYQYSNLPFPSLPMQSTAERFVTFAPGCDRAFTWPGVSPPAFTHAGYVYDSAFARVAPRARARRQRLRDAGATFVIGLFDESVQLDKYGYFSASRHAAELLLLLERVLSDPALGVVFKTQFHKNLAQVPRVLQDTLDRALATGRVELPSKGRHRNIVLPAEVAQSCDLTIGHALGGTAALESALAGCRSILVNGAGVQSMFDPLYESGDILFGSIEEAYGAIEAFRRGERPSLGDWRPILPHFDPFRDGRSDSRLSAILAEAVTG